MSIKPTNPSNWLHINSQCSEELKVSNSAGQVVSCLSACTKQQIQLYLSSLCILYAYDDNKSTFTCSNTCYELSILLN